MAEASSPARTLDVQLFRDVFDASPIAIAVENLNGEPLFVNPAFCKFLGFTEEALRSKHCVDFSPPEDAKKDWEFFQRLRAGSIDHYQMEKRYFRGDGSLVWGSLSLSLLQSRPSPLVIAMIEDITAKKVAEEALRCSEERLRLAQQAARIGTFERNVRTGLVSWSPEMESIYGLPPGGFDGTKTAFNELIHPEDRVKVIELSELALKSGEPMTGEWRVVWPDGSIHWIAGRWQVFADESGEPSRVAGVNMDVTERKQADDALRESEEKFHSVFRDAGVGMVIVSLEGRFLAANKTFCDFLGYTEDELLAKTVESITFAQDWPGFAQKLQGTLTNGGSFQWFEKRCLHKSGEIVHTQSSASLIRSSDGAPRYFVGEVLDVTTRKQAEEALAGMTRKLIEAQEQERARIGRELHDDINQRLAMLAIQLEKLQDDPSQVQEHVKQLKKELFDISNDVQALSHELHSSKMEYLGVVAGFRSWCNEFGDRQNMKVNFKSDVVNPISTDIGVTLFRVLQEALHNAIKHSGVKQVEVQLSEHSDEIHLTINDAGRGFEIDAAKQGRGLGLASMEERVRLVKGTIAIDSKPMGGTRIRVRVPVASARIPTEMAG
jgi:PAS domain S-box-containing protein